MKKNKKKVSKKVSVSKPVPHTSGKTQITPLADRILLKPLLPTDLETKNNFGIIIPDTISKERPEQGVVMAVGDGRTENGKLIPMKVKVGDTVIFSKYGFDEVKVDGNELYILKEDSILAIIK